MTSVGVIVPSTGINFGFTVGDIISNAVALIGSLNTYVVLPLAIITVMALLGIVFWVFRKMRPGSKG